MGQLPKLQLERPLVFFDLETTGVDPAHDRIVEIGMVKVMPDGSEETLASRVNPEMPIPPAVSEVHHITDADVTDKPSFRELAPRIARFLEGCDLAGYNCNRFDLPMLDEEFHRAEVPIDLHSRRVVDVQVIYHKRESRTLSAAHRFYCGCDFDGAHGALADTEATYNVLRGQLAMYPDLPNDVAELDRYTKQKRMVDFSGRFVYDDRDRVVFNFGKYKGRPVKEILATEPGYFGWMMKSDFPEDTKNQLRRIKKELDQEQESGSHVPPQR